MSWLCSKEKTDVENETEDELYERLKRPSSVLDDLLVAIYEVRLVAPFILVASVLIAYQLFVAPYQVEVDNAANRLVDLSQVRPVLSKEVQIDIRETVFHSETFLWLHGEKEEVISLKFQPSIDRHGSYYLPEFFYEGLLLGITSNNPHNLEFTARNDRSLHELRSELLESIPRPTEVFKRVSTNHDRGWREEGLAVFYRYADLEKQGLLSSDTSRPFKRILPRLLEVARKHRQVYVTLYFPHTFGQTTSWEGTGKPPPAPSALPEVASRYSSQRPAHRYTTVLREVLPTRTGLDAVKSSCVVWLSSVDGGEPRLADEGYLASIVYKKAPDGGEL